jgi:hypothetical protein
MDRRRPFRSESSLCNAPRRIVGGELLCLVNALVPMTKVKKESNRRVEVRTGMNFVRDCLNLFPCSVEFRLDLAAEAILHQ